MNIKDIISDKKGISSHIFNSSYYSNVYKKTERISAAVFLVTEKTNVEKDKDMVDAVNNVREEALAALAAVIRFLSGEHTNAGMVEATARLSSLRSLLLILATVRAVRSEFIDVLSREIDTVLAHMHSLYNDEGAFDLFERADSTEQSSLVVTDAPRRAVRSQTPRPTVPRTTQTPAADRRGSIRAIIAEKGIVSIKDISDAITDVSEKTIQRELIEMIKDSIILKEGERRWSRYKLVS